MNLLLVFFCPLSFLFCPGTMQRPDLVLLHQFSTVQWKIVVVNVKITSTDKMNEAFREKDELYREWATKETRETKVAKAVMVPLIISHDGAVHKDTIRRWKDFSPEIKIDWVRMAQNVLRNNVVIVGRCFNKGSWVSEAWKKDRAEEKYDEAGGPQRETQLLRNEENCYILTKTLSAACVRSSGTPPPHGVRLTSARRGNPTQHQEQANQPT